LFILAFVYFVPLVITLNTAPITYVEQRSVVFVGSLVEEDPYKVLTHLLKQENNDIIRFPAETYPNLKTLSNRQMTLELSYIDKPFLVPHIINRFLAPQKTYKRGYIIQLKSLIIEEDFI
jgi:nitrate reductase cytochrome c-type subunit